MNLSPVPGPFWQSNGQRKANGCARKKNTLIVISPGPATQRQSQKSFIRRSAANLPLWNCKDHTQRTIMPRIEVKQLASIKWLS